jgi:hypothetical protein
MPASSIRLCAQSRIVQPLRQLWWETYKLTTAEYETGLYTDRCAGHVLRFGQSAGWLAAAAGPAGSCLARGMAATAR